MTINDVIKLIESNSDKPLTRLQEQILRCSWRGQTYAEMAISLHYQEAYLKNLASQLWQELSTIQGETITKGNFRMKFEPEFFQDAQEENTVLDCLSSSKTSVNGHNISPTVLPKKANNIKVTSLDHIIDLPIVDFPGSPIALQSHGYIERPPIESLAYREVLQPGSVCSIQAPSKMGKSSLLIRVLQKAVQADYAIVTINFNSVDRETFGNLDRFLRWICVNISQQLALPSTVDNHWDEIMGSKVNATLYLQEQILAVINRPLVLAFNEFHRLFDHLDVMQDVMALLRFWHEQSKQELIWENLRLIIVHSVKSFVSFDPNQSPFNVGLSIEIPPFSVSQVQDLATRYGLNWNEADGVEKAQQLVALLGGHPYLINLAFYNLCYQQVSWISLLNLSAPAIAMYRNFLDNQLKMLERTNNLLDVFQQVLAGSLKPENNLIVIAQLQSLGMIRIEEKQVYPLCELYRHYFSERVLAK